MAETAEEFLGPRELYEKKDKPQTAEEFLGPRELYEADRLNGPAWDQAFEADTDNGRMMSRFSQGFSRAFGPEPLGLDRVKIAVGTDDAGKPIQKSLTQLARENGLFPRASNEMGSVLQEFNEGLFRGTVALADLAMRGSYAAARGAVETADVPGTIPTIIAPLGAAVAAGMEAFPAGHATAFPVRGGSLLYPHNLETMIDLAKVDSPHAVDPGVVERLAPEQNRGGRGTVLEARPEPPDPTQVLRDSVTRQVADKMAEASKLREEGRQYGAVPPDVIRLEAEARRLQERLDGLPETPPTETVPPPQAMELDNLRGQREQLSSWLRDLIDAPPETFRIGGVEVPANTPLVDLPAAAARADEGPTGRQAAQASIAEELRRGIGEIDNRISEILPDVREAAKEQGPAITFEFARPIYADVGLPPEGEVPLPHGVTPNPGGGFDIATTQGIFYAKGDAEATRIAAKYETLAQRRPTIAQEVYRDLRESNRPDAEARAGAALVQAYYETRAARFDGQLGTARDLYDADAPDVRTGVGRNRGAYSVAEKAVTLFKDADASTFIHESAHDWFEDLLKDAKRENAPADLIADLDAVKAWLQMKGDRPTKGQHEKFARGFERYMMEGVAPSPKLATTFEKFRDWLVKLYQTVSRLRAPITDEIRGVYDRLLSTPRNEAIIGPDRDLRGSFADAHEADLASTPPEQALAKAEQIRAERDDIATIIRQEINLGRQRVRAAARAARGAAEGGESGVTVPEPGAKRLPTEPPGVRPGEEAAAVGDERTPPTVEREVVTRPDQPAGPTETRLIDKAGNIRLDNLSAPEDVEQAIRQSADYNNGFGQERRGILTDADIITLATSLGRDAAFLDKKVIGEAFNAEEIVAARILLRQSELDVRAAMREVNEGGDPLKLAQAMMRNEMIQGKVSQATAEWGRAGRAFRELSAFKNGDALAEFLKDNKGDFGRTYDQLLQMARHGEFLDNPGQMNNFVRKTHGGRWPIVVYYLNSLLSGPITHSVYAIGNELRAISEPLFTAPVGAAYGSVRAGIARVAGREAPTDRVYWDEVYASMYGFAKGHLQGWRTAKEAFNTGAQVVLPGLKGYAGNLLLTGLETTEGTRGTGVGRMISGIAEGDVRKAGAGLWQTYQLPYRSVAAIHSFGVSVRYYQNVYRYATRQALSEGLAGDALRTRIAKLTTDPTPELMRQAYNDRAEIMPHVPEGVRDWAALSQKASEEAMRVMYMRVYDYNSAAATTIRGLHSNPFTAMMVPFVKVGLEIQRENYIKHSPLGYLHEETRGQLLGREGGAAMDEANARQTLGMSLMGGGALLSALGVMTDGGPANPEERQVWELTHTPYSLQLGPITIPMQGIPVLGDLLSFGADMYAMGSTHWNKPEYGQLIGNYLRAFQHAAFEQGFFRDLADIGSMIHEPGRYLSRWLLNFTPNFMPWSVGMGQVNRFGFDPYSKDIHGFDARAVIDSFKRQIPFASYYVPDRIDMFGNPIKSRGSWAAHHQELLNDPVAQRLNAMHLGIGHPERSIEGVELSTPEYEHYATVAGKLTYQMLLPYVNNPGLTRLPLGAQRLVVKDIIEAARGEARGLIMAESMKNNPTDNLVTKSIKQKQEALK